MRHLFPANTHMKQQVENQAWVSYPALFSPHPKIGPNCNSSQLLGDDISRILPTYKGRYNVLRNAYSLLDPRVDLLGVFARSDLKPTKPNRKDLLIRCTRIRYQPNHRIQNPAHTFLTTSPFRRLFIYQLSFIHPVTPFS